MRAGLVVAHLRKHRLPFWEVTVTGENDVFFQMHMCPPLLLSLPSLWWHAGNGHDENPTAH